MLGQGLHHQHGRFQSLPAHQRGQGSGAQGRSSFRFVWYAVILQGQAAGSGSPCASASGVTAVNLTKARMAATPPGPNIMHKITPSNK